MVSIHQRLILLLLSCLISGQWASAQAPPSATHAQPSAIDPRATTRIAIHGEQFVAPIRILCSAPVKHSMVEVTDKKVVIDITPESELALGPIGLWVATSHGMSAPLSLLVDPLPTVSESTDNHSPLTAQSIGAGSAIDGLADGKQLDYFRFHADQDQLLTFEVLAEPIGSACDPVVRVLREADSRVVRTIDDDAVSPDCRFRHRFETAGNYLLEIHDNRYRAGGRYRLRMGQLPMVSFAYPPVAQRGTCAEIRFAGPDATSLASCSVNVPQYPGLSAMNITAVDKQSGAAGWSTISLSDSIQMIESEPNDSIDQANAIASAQGLSGLLEKTGDRDLFRITAAKDQLMRFFARSRSFGSASVVKLSIRNAAGEVLAKSAVTDADEPQLDFKFPSDGEYLLEVQDLVERGGPEHGYHVAIETQPSFKLQLKPDAVTRNSWAIQPSGGAAALAILVQRQGYDGPIELQLSPALPGLRLLTSSLPAGSKDATLILQPDSTFDPQSFERIGLSGSAVSPPADQKVAPAWLSSAALLVQRAPHQPYPPSWQTSTIPIVGVQDAPPLFTWAEVPAPEKGSKPLSASDSITTKPVSLVRSNPAGTITLKLKRNVKEFKGPVTFISSELPKGWSATPKLDKDVLSIAVKHPTEKEVDSDDGQRPAEQLKFRFFGEHAGRGQLIETIVPVELVTPLSVNLIALKPMTSGQSQTVSVEIVRRAIADQPVAIRVENLPKGVTAPEVTIAADQSKADVVITAAADAEAVEVNNVVFSASTKDGNQEYAASSPPAVLTISRP